LITRIARCARGRAPSAGTAARRSFARLGQVPAEVVCFGHGDPLVGASGAAAWEALGRRCLGGPDAVPDPLG